MSSWSVPRQASWPVEIPRGVLARALQPRAAGVGTSAERHVLVAALNPGARSGRPPRPVFAVFDDLDEARAEFQALRLRANPPTAWAQVLAVDPKGRLRPLCWFGTSSSSLQGSRPALSPAAGTVAEVKPAGRRRWTWTRKWEKGSRRDGAPSPMTAYGTPDARLL